ncbi:MAG: hypothetical protein GXO87_03080, partial [Chlorobi bacterium]|nr:hypothetical protein [Chlorobiota bacterium]
MNKILIVKISTFVLLFAAGNLIAQNEYNFRYSFNETALVSGSSAGLSISASLGRSIVGTVSSETKTVRVKSANYFVGINGITAADNMEANAPEAYQLKQNYPNPFNPSTVIEFSVPEESFVSIVIYSVLGEKV